MDTNRQEIQFWYDGVYQNLNSKLKYGVVLFDFTGAGVWFFQDTGAGGS